MHLPPSEPDFLSIFWDVIGFCVLLLIAILFAFGMLWMEDAISAQVSQFSQMKCPPPGKKIRL